MKKKILSFILSLIIMIGTLSMTITATAIDTSVDISAKLSEGLKQKMNEYADDEYIPIYVWLDSVGDDVVYQVLSKKAGTEITANTEDAYITSRIESKLDVYKKIELEKQSSIDVATMTAQAYSLKENVSVDDQITSFRNQLQIPAIMTDAEIKTCIESEMPIEKIIEVAERNQFLSDFRGSRKGLNEITNSAFENEIDKTKCKNIFVDPALPFVTMECKKSYIEILAQFTNVTEIGYHEEVEFITDATEEAEIATQEEAVASTEESTSSTTTNPHIVSGNYLMTPHETLGYTGAGVKVGVLEAKTYFNESNPHLAGATIESLANANQDYITHSTQVLSIICGQPCSLNGVTYQGMAPGAEVYYAKTIDLTALKNNLNWLINTCYVSVVNMSFGICEEEFIIYDQYVDCYIQQYRIIVVVSAGNQRTYVASPGLSYNAITVGNVSNTLSNGKYVMSTGSSYQEESFLTNKPDLSAFGTNITMLQTNTSTWTASGTSFAAPMVTGTVALMLQANSNLIGKPDAVKALLMQTAEEDKISVSSNSLVCQKTNGICTDAAGSTYMTCECVLRERSGAGLLNISGAITAASTGMFESRVFEEMYFFPGMYWTSDPYYFEAGKTIEIVLVHEKNTHDIPTGATNETKTNADLYVLKNSNGQQVAYSKSTINNVEIIKCTIQESAYYRFKVLYQDVDVLDDDLFDYDTDEDPNNDYFFGDEHTNAHYDGYYSITFACCNSPNLTHTADGYYYCSNCSSNLCKEL